MNMENVNILLIESELSTVRKIKRLVEEPGSFKVNLTCIDRINSLVENIKEQHVDLLLINPHINGSKGFEIFSLLRLEFIHLPYIVLVHSEDLETGRNTLKLGAQDFLSIENLSAENLLHSIECAIGRFNFALPFLGVEKNFLRAKNLLEKIFSSLNEAVFVYDLNNRKIITCNPAVQKVFGYSNAEMIGKSAEVLHLGHEEFEEYKTKSKDILSKRGFYLTEYKMKRKDGRIIDTEHRITLLKKSKGWNDMVVAVVNDVTERKQIEHALIQAKENAEKSDRLKTEFLAQMSHEIRTPINIILSHTSQLREEFQGSLSDDLIMSFKAINKAGKRIIRTIDLILNMSEMLTGNYELRNRNIDIYLDILLNIYIEFKNTALDKNVELNLHKFTENTEITGDEYSVTQIFQHLIENAVKYTSNGKIDIRIIRNDEGRLIVDIEDTGIGMSQEYMSKLFAPFTQEHQGYTRLFEGNGLGLALVKKYSELNNAEIKVFSTKDAGTKFTITFGEKQDRMKNPE